MSSKDSYNWHGYNLYVKGNFTEQDINVVLERSARSTNNHIERVIQQCWQDANKGRISVGFDPLRQTTVYRLNYFKISEKLVLSLGETTFQELQGTNATNWILGDIYGSEYLANGILVQALVFTREGKLVLGKRNSRVKEGFETWANFGGSLEKDEVEVRSSRDLFEMMMKEIREEVGVDDVDISSLTLHALFEDWKHYPVLLFIAQLNRTKAEVEDKFNIKGALEEHLGLVFKTIAELQETIDSNPERLSDLTLASIEIYTTQMLKKVRSD